VLEQLLPHVPEPLCAETDEDIFNLICHDGDLKLGESDAVLVVFLGWFFFLLCLLLIGNRSRVRNCKLNIVEADFEQPFEGVDLNAVVR
jgi:hypothetical protein